MSFISISKIHVAPDCLGEAYDFLHEAGKMQWEAVVLWAGRRRDNIFNATEAIVPDQTPIDTGEGLCYCVQGDELFRLNKYLYENQLELIAQLHTHPARAYHSELDDLYPIVTTKGGVSIVIPDFAQGKLNICNWAFYRLSEQSSWDELSIARTQSLFFFEEDTDAFG